MTVTNTTDGNSADEIQINFPAFIIEIDPRCFFNVEVNAAQRLVRGLDALYAQKAPVREEELSQRWQVQTCQTVKHKS